MRPAEHVLVIQTQGENAGAQEISRLVGAGLEARGYRVTHLFFYRKSPSFDAPPNTRYCVVDRPRTPLDALRFLWRLGREIRALRPDAILTFQHYGNTVGGAVARLVATAPVVANQVSAPLTVNGAARVADLLLGLIGAFRRITVNSPDMLRDYGRYPGPYSRRLVLVPHGFDRKRSTLSPGAARDRFALPADVVLIGSVGRLNPLKRLDAAIRMLPGRAGWHLALAGQGPHEAALRSLAAEAGVADRVHFVGELPPERIGDFLAGLDAFVFPTAAETFGLAAVEAASAGVPVVASDLPILRAVLAGQAGPAALFVDASEPTQIGAGVARVLGDAVLAAALRRGGAALAARYSVERMVDGYDAILRDLREAAPERLADA